MESLIDDIRTGIIEKCKNEKKPYRLSVGIGMDKMDKNEADSFECSLKRADEKMYRNKNDTKASA